MSAESQPDEEFSSASSSQQASSGPSPEWIQGDEYRILLESFAQAIWETDAAGKVVVDSPSWRAFTGQTLAQWLDKGWVGAVHPDEQALALTQWQEAVSQRLSVNVEFRLHRPDAGWSWTNVRATPIFNPDQSISKWMGVNIDISKRKNAEEALRQSEERLQIVMGSITDHAMITYDTGNVITGWNVGAQRMFGFMAQEAIGQLGDIIFTPEDRATGEPQKEVIIARREGRAADERYHIRKDGSRLYVSGVMSPLYDAGRELIGYVKVARDLTERQQMEQALKESDRRKDEFMALLAHELRNPMATLHNTLLILLLTGGKDPSLPLQSAVEMMSREVSQLVRLVDDLLDVSRINRGKTGLSREPLELTTVVRQTTEASRLLLEIDGRQFDVSLPEMPLYINGDVARLTQIIRNLLSNALKFTLKGGHIELVLEQQANEAVICVRDDGIGIPADQLSHIFEMFAQVDSSRTRSQGGLGLGLTLVRQFAEMHGGRVVARSEGLNRGSEFCVYLPLITNNTLV